MAAPSSRGMDETKTGKGGGKGSATAATSSALFVVVVSKLCITNDDDDDEYVEMGLVGKVDEKRVCLGRVVGCGIQREGEILCASFKMDFRIRISSAA